MDLATRCPHCGIRLLVDPQWKGQSVQCEECDREFTVEAESTPTSQPKSQRRRTPRPTEDDPLFDYEFDDRRPIRAKPRPKPSPLIPMLFGSVLILTVLTIAIGLSFSFGFIPSRSFSFELSQRKFNITKVTRLPNRGVQVFAETTDGARPVGNYRFVWKSEDGQSHGQAHMMMSTPRHQQFLMIPQKPNQKFVIWIEENPPAAGDPVLSNVYSIRD